MAHDQGKGSVFFKREMLLVYGNDFIPAAIFVCIYAKPDCTF